MACVTALLTIHALLLACSAALHSPTLNEPGHFAAGVSVWEFNRFDVYNVNPPLVRMTAALPVALSGAQTDWSAFQEGPGARSEYALGEGFVAANSERALGLFALARWACIPFSLLGGYVCFRWAREAQRASVQGSGGQYIAGCLAVTLWCFCPNVLAHGCLVTPDMGASALAVCACYAFWRWLTTPAWWQTLGCGFVLGLAQLTKTTLLVLYPLWVLMWVVHRWVGSGEPAGVSRRVWRRETGMLVVQFAVSVYVLNLGYGFEETFTQLGAFRFVSSALGAKAGEAKAPAGGGNRFADSWMASLPVPLPKNYLLGIDLQRRDFENYHAPSYLGGEFREKGWWYYYLYALAIKVPLGTWALFFLAATAGWWRRALQTPNSKRQISNKFETPNSNMPNTTQVSSALGQQCRLLAPREESSRGARGLYWRDEFVLLAPAVTILVFVSSQTGFSEHMRYVLPIFPFVYIWIGRIAFVFEREWWQGSRETSVESLEPKRTSRDLRQSSVGRFLRNLPDGFRRNPATRRRAMTILVLAMLAWSVGSSLAVYPHSLSYFNELVGGPTGGPKHLIHSNVDWGQDLLFLKKWLDKHPAAKPINLVYFGYFDPKHAGIEYTVAETLLGKNEGGVPLPSIPPGWYAVSVNFVRGYPYFLYKADGTKARLPLKALTAFQQLKPVAMAGYSIYIYHVEPRDKGRESRARGLE